MLQLAPFNVFDATAAGSSLSKTLWPGTFTNTLPSTGKGNVSSILSGSSVVGGVFSPTRKFPSCFLDFCAVGTADQTLVVEIGKLQASGAIAIPLASVSLKSITTAGTVANFNPFTGASVPATTFRLFDLTTVTALGNYLQVVKNVGGAEDETPCQLLLDTEEAQYYYVIITTLPAGLTEVIAVATPVSIAMDRTK